MAIEDAFGMALKGDCRGFLGHFARQSDEDLLRYRTVNGDSAIHIAAAMEDPQLIQEFLGRLTPETRLELLKQTDAYGNTGLHEAPVAENFDVARVLVDFSRKSGDAYQSLLEARNELGETPVYRAAALGKTKVLQMLTEQVGDLRRHFRRKDDNSILHMAVLGQHFETAMWLLKHDSSLADKRATPKSHENAPNRHNGLTCLELLALMPTAFKSADPMKISTSLCYYCLPTWLDDDCNYKEDLETDKIDNCIGCKKKRGGILIWKMYIGFWRQAIKGCSGIREIWKKKKMHENAVALVKRLVEIRRLKPSSSAHEAETTEQEGSETAPEKVSTISLGFGKGDDIRGKKLVDISAEELIEVLGIKGGTNKAVDDHKKVTIEDGKGEDIRGKKLVDISDEESIEVVGIKDGTNKADDDHKKATTEDRTLLFAASNGITEILEEILQQDPQAILYDVNDKGQTILHVAIRRRQHDIFKLIMEKMQLYVPKWAVRIDQKGYTILHHAADMKHYKQSIRPGPVLQFQEELQWFERVKEIMPRHYTMHRDRNKDMTASDLFRLTHEDQLRKAQEWIKETAQACSVLAILIATVVFTAAFTIPGGNNERGLPHFLKSPLFYVFAVTDVVSLSLSLSSVVMFLSILTSPRESSDFLSNLPSKLTIGFTLLFFSVFTSMITFSASLLLIIRLEKKWTGAALYAAAIVPVIVLALMEFPVYANFAANLKDYLEPSKKKKKKKHCR